LVIEQEPDHMNALRYLAEIASRTDDKASLKRYLSIIIAKEERESSPDVIRDYKKLLKVYSTVLPTTPLNRRRRIARKSSRFSTKSFLFLR
jgi:hypothetical protein